MARKRTVRMGRCLQAGCDCLGGYTKGFKGTRKRVTVFCERAWNGEEMATVGRKSIAVSWWLWTGSTSYVFDIKVHHTVSFFPSRLDTR